MAKGREKLQEKWKNDKVKNDELKEMYLQKEYAHHLKCLSKAKTDDENYKLIRKKCKTVKNEKMIEFFSDKTAKDFKNSKKFHRFYKSYIKSKNNKTSNSIPAFISDGKNSADNPEAIAGLFNKFFTNIKSDSVENVSESAKYIQETFNNLKKEKLINTPECNFSFNKVTTEQIVKAFEKISSESSPGYSGIPSKILVNSLKELSPILMSIFNYCIQSGTIPDEWKFSIVLPLFKNKGNADDCNNYRGISLLSPIAKIFETLLANQVSHYFESNNLFHPSQHGFRKNYSCESALHEIISESNDAKDKRLIALLLFKINKK